MGERKYNRDGINHTRPGRTILTGIVELDATGAVTAMDFPGITTEDADVYVSHGLYQFDFQDPIVELINATVCVRNPTDVGVRWYIEEEVPLDLSRIRIRFKSLSSPSGNKNPVSCTLHIMFEVDHSSDE